MISVLYCTPGSVYKTMGVDCFDKFRDARTFRGWDPVIAHPPCRGWGRLRHMAHVRPDELALGVHAVQQVRRCGGVLEHPAGSLLWERCGLPAVGCVDGYGGETVSVNQGDFGHPAKKHTWLYVVNVARPGELCKAFAGDTTARPGELCKVENQPPARRMDTPPLFAALLLGLATLAGDDFNSSFVAGFR